MRMICIKAILDKIEYAKFSGNENTQISEFIQFNPENSCPDKLMWVNSKNLHKISPLTVGTVICSSDIVNKNPLLNLIIVDNPRNYFRMVVEHFFISKGKPIIQKTAIIDNNCCIGKNVSIGHHTVIEKNTSIGCDTQIGHNTVILEGSIIGNNVVIGSNTTIGGTGFGYDKDLDGRYSLIPHIGNVVIEDNVEIGNNTAIDRGVLGSTLIRRNAKIDNLVHIAHGVEIGENTLIIANSMISGSTIIGNNVWIAPSVSVIENIKINNGAFIGIGSVIVKNIKENARVFGNPAKSTK